MATCEHGSNPSPHAGLSHGKHSQEKQPLKAPSAWGREHSSHVCNRHQKEALMPQDRDLDTHSSTLLLAPRPQLSRSG